MDLNTSTTINIKIGDGADTAPEEGTAASPESPVTDPAKTKRMTESTSGGGAGIKQSSGYAVAAQLGKQALAFATSRVGAVTRDSNTQALIGTVGQFIGYGAMIAANPALGIPTVALSLATQAIDFSFQRGRAEYARSVALERAGRSNRSR